MRTVLEPEEVDKLTELFAEIDSALDQGTQAMPWGTDEVAKKLQGQVAGTKVVKLVKVRRNAVRMLTPQPQLHAADAPWRLTMIKREPDQLYVKDCENWSLQ